MCPGGTRVGPYIGVIELHIGEQQQAGRIGAVVGGVGS